MSGGPLVPKRPAAKLKLASSLESAGKDELVLLDRRGGVLDRGGVRRAYARAYVGALAQGVAWGVTMVTAAWLHPVAGVVGLSGYVWFIASKMRWQVPLKRALALLSARRYDEAYDKLLALSETPMPRANLPHVQQLLAGVTWVRGDHTRALALFDSAIGATATLTSRNAVACRWICTLSRAHLLVVMGRGDEVRQRLAALDDAPAGDFFQLLREQVRLALAFDAGDVKQLPDVLTVHEWARAALLRNRFGSTLVYLAWAFAELGELDMARLCLAESVDRIEHDLAPSMPKLFAWAEARRAEWKED